MNKSANQILFLNDGKSQKVVIFVEDIIVNERQKRCVPQVNMGSQAKSSYPLEVDFNKDLLFGNIYINYLMEQLYSSFSLGASFSLGPGMRIKRGHLAVQRKLNPPQQKILYLDLFYSNLQSHSQTL